MEDTRKCWQMAGWIVPSAEKLKFYFKDSVKDSNCRKEKVSYGTSRQVDRRLQLR